MIGIVDNACGKVLFQELERMTYVTPGGLQVIEMVSEPLCSTGGSPPHRGTTDKAVLGKSLQDYKTYPINLFSQPYLFFLLIKKSS